VRTSLAALLIAAGLGAAPSQAQPASAKIEVLHDSRMPAALFSATTAIRVIASPLEPDSTEAMLNPNLRVDVERAVLRPDGTIERRITSMRPGVLECFDDYIADYVPSVSGHIFPSFLRWPRDAEAPVELGGGADVYMSGPGIVFVPFWPTETVQETRARMTRARMSPEMALLLPQGLQDPPQSSVRAGTSPTGAPLLLAVQGGDRPGSIAINVIETGRDPVAMHRAELKIDGVTEALQAAVLSTWRAQPALRFAYRVPANDFNSLVVGAATCDPPRALSEDIVACHPVVRMRVPSYANDLFQQMKEADRALIAIAEGGTRAFVLTTDSRRWCLRIAPLDSSTVAAPSPCVFELPGAAIGLGGVSDSEVLLLVTDVAAKPTSRLLRVRGL